MCLIRAAWALWLLGYPHQALTRLHEAVRLAQDIGHPFSLAFALADAAIVHQHRREPQAVQAHAEATIALAREHGFAYWLAFGTILRGWSLAIQGQWQEGHVQLHGGLDAWRATTPDDVQAAARKYLDARHRTTIRVVPARGTAS